jgi:hypothetical protein
MFVEIFFNNKTLKLWQQQLDGLRRAKNLQKPI